MPIMAARVALGSRLPWFDLVDLDGCRRSSADLAEGKPVVLAFLCNHSPYVRHIERHLGQSMARAIRSGVSVIGLAPNDPIAYPTDSIDSLRSQVVRAGFTFPYCIDEAQGTAKALGAACTPQFFLYDAPDGHLVYHGQYDASRPSNTIDVTGSDLLTAIDQALKSEVVSPKQEMSFGCSIKWTDGRVPHYLSVMES